MKKTMLTILALIVVFIAGCGSKVYHGKYITTELKNQPIDEFKVGDFVVLGFENQSRRPTWLFSFVAYLRLQPERELFVIADEEGKFAIKEKHEGKLLVRATFITEPSYQVARERAISVLRNM